MARQRRVQTPEFRITGVGAVTALEFTPETWPTGADKTRMRVVSLASGIGVSVTLPGVENLARWFAEWSREFEIHGDGVTAVLAWSSGYVEVDIWRHSLGRRNFDRNGRMSLDPEAVDQVCNFLAVLHRDGWETWNGDNSDA